MGEARKINVDKDDWKCRWFETSDQKLCNVTMYVHWSFSFYGRCAYFEPNILPSQATIELLLHRLKEPWNESPLASAIALE